eukprot:4240465-Pleurochrysis_carterae.AAC.1
MRTPVRARSHVLASALALERIFLVHSLACVRSSRRRLRSEAHALSRQLRLALARSPLALALSLVALLRARRAILTQPESPPLSARHTLFFSSQTQARTT